MVHTGLAINKLEQGTENTFRGRDDNATVLQELSEKAMQERATFNCMQLTKSVYYKKPLLYPWCKAKPPQVVEGQTK